MDRIAVLVPCYNEALTVEKVVKEYKQALPEAVIYVYDNNSTDGTADIAKIAGAVVRKEPMQGKGNVVRSMFRQIDADCYIMVDGDNTYPADNAREMVRLVLEEGYDMVIGDRLSATYFTENKRAFHNSGNKLIRKLVNGVFNGDVGDIMTGLRAFSPTFVKTFPVLSGGFEIETEMTIHALDKRLRLTSVLIDYRDRQEGSVSKLNTVSDGIKVLGTIFTLYKDYRPLSFFSWTALVLVIIAVAVFIPAVLISYIKTGQVANFPTLIVCGFVCMAGLLSLVCGFILDALTKKGRREFEYLLLQRKGGREN